MSAENENLDRPLYGAEPIGREAHILDENGNVDIRRTFYALEKGYISADKFGRGWVSTPRRIRQAFSGKTA